jgi:ABC-2 type transport system ATP-binding protein
MTGVNKRFGPTHAVRDLDLEVATGSLCGFVGPNGAGKSTTIRMIMSIIYPDSGNIEVLGGSAMGSKDRIGYLPEERGLYRKMRVCDFLSYMALLKEVPRKGLADRIQSWLDRVDLGDCTRKKCEELSKGMQQKVQFIASVIHEPELLSRRTCSTRRSRSAIASS